MMLFLNLTHINFRVSGYKARQMSRLDDTRIPSSHHEKQGLSLAKAKKKKNRKLYFIQNEYFRSTTTYTMRASTLILSAATGTLVAGAALNRNASSLDRRLGPKKPQQHKILPVEPIFNDFDADSIDDSPED